MLLRDLHKISVLDTQNNLVSFIINCHLNKSFIEIDKQQLTVTFITSEENKSIYNYSLIGFKVDCQCSSERRPYNIMVSTI